MDLKSFSILGLVLLIITLMYSTIGSDVTLLIFAIIFLVKAILYSIKPKYYDKFLSFMNPGVYSAYNEKGSDFIRKKRIMTIIGYYIFSAIMGFNSLMQIRSMNKIDTKSAFDFSEFFPFALIALGGIFIMNCISILITKRSKTANKDLWCNVILEIVFAIILIAFVNFKIL